MYSRNKRQQILHFAQMGPHSEVKAVWLRRTMNRLQAADYLPHVTRGGLDSEPNGDTQVSTEAQGDE